MESEKKNAWTGVWLLIGTCLFLSFLIPVMINYNEFSPYAEDEEEDVLPSLSKEKFRAKIHSPQGRLTAVESFIAVQVKRKNPFPEGWHTFLSCLDHERFSVEGRGSAMINFLNTRAKYPDGSAEQFLKEWREFSDIFKDPNEQDEEEQDDEDN